jgi:ribosomal-protein-alanine N-acetyltransferase
MPPIDLQLLTRRASYYHTERLALRPFAFADIWPLWEATRDPGFNRQLRWHAPSTAEDLGLRLERFLAQFKRGELAALSALQRKTGQWVAMYRFTPWRDGLEMGLWIHPAYWRDGIGSELTRLAILIAFSETAVSALYACVQPGNLAAQRVLQKVGLVQQERCVTPHESGAPLDTLVYVMTRQAYADRSRCEGAGAVGVQRFDPAYGRFESCTPAPNASAESDRAATAEASPVA